MRDYCDMGSLFRRTATTIAVILCFSLVAGAVQAAPGSNFQEIERGGSMETGLTLNENNYALASWGAIAFASGESHFPSHQIDYLNDGFYGNGSCWILEVPATTVAFAGIRLAQPLEINRIAFGNTNTGDYLDRNVGFYTFQYTTVENPDAETPDEDWVTIAEIEKVGPSTPDSVARRLFGFDPIPDVTGIRIQTQVAGIRIDEIEVYEAQVDKAIYVAPTDGAVVNPSAQLRWVASSNAAGHNVYFGESRSAVANATDPHTHPGRGFQTATTWPSGRMPYGTWYWRIDEVIGSSPIVGDVWSFSNPNFPPVAGGNVPTFGIHMRRDTMQSAYVEWDPMLELYNNYTIEFWVNPVELGTTDNYLIGKGDLAEVEGWAFCIGRTGNIAAMTHGGAWDPVSFPHSKDGYIKTGVWTHVALVHDIDNNLHLYINGLFKETMEFEPLVSNFEPLRFGDGLLPSGSFPQHAFNGAMDEIRLWSTARSAADIAAYYSDTIEPSANLVAYWRFEDAGGTTFADLSGNNIHGNLGTATWGNGAPLFLPETTHPVSYNLDTIVRLAARDAYDDPLVITISSLPTNGQLYQYADGERGEAISDAPAVVTDTEGRVIFEPVGVSAGNVVTLVYDAFDGLVDSNSATYNLQAVDRLIETDPSAVDFGWQDVTEGPSTTITLTLTSAGGDPVTIRSMGLEGGTPGVFSMTPSSFFNQVLPSAASVDFALTFNPVAVGASTTTLRISTDRPGDDTIVIPITGHGNNRPSTGAMAYGRGPGANFQEIERGGSMESGLTRGDKNWAHAFWGGIPWASGESHNPVHQIVFLNDGLYGNPNCWIYESPPGEIAFAGITLAQPLDIDRIAFGNTNTGDYLDRSAGYYWIQYTTVANPNETTSDADWMTVGEVEKLPPSTVNSVARRLYGFNTVTGVTGVRIRTRVVGIRIDEIEIYEANPSKPAPLQPLLVSDALYETQVGVDVIFTVKWEDADDDPTTLTIDSLPAMGTVYQYVEEIGRGDVVALGDSILDPQGRLVYVPCDAADDYVATCIWTVTDGKQVSFPGTATFEVSATPTDMALVNSAMTTVKGAAKTIDAASLLVTGDTPVTYRVDSLAGSGVLLLDGVALAENDTFTQADVNAGLLQYQHNDSDGDSDSFALSYRDGDEGYEATTFDIAIDAANTPPEILASEGSSVVIGTYGVISNKGLLAEDAQDAATLLTFTLETGPVLGALWRGSTPLGAGSTFTQADVDAGRVWYRNLGGHSLPAADQMAITVTDSLGASAEGTFTIDIGYPPAKAGEDWLLYE